MFQQIYNSFTNFDNKVTKSRITEAIVLGQSNRFIRLHLKLYFKLIYVLLLILLYEYYLYY